MAARLFGGIMDGFFNKVLFVDVGRRISYEKEVPDRVYETFLGGKGLGLRLLLDNNRPGVDPLSPENNLVFAIGPATDSRVHGSARYGVFTRSPQTGFFSESYSGGTVADKISRTGFDAVVLYGASETPVVVEVTVSGVRFHDASGLWGKEAYESEDSVKEMIGIPGAEAVVIGPGGENRVSFATINNNYWRCAGRTGVGAVLGSKKVKALVFHGDRKRGAARPDVLDSHWKSMKDLAKTDKGVATYKRFGTVNMVAVANEAGVFPTRYWSQGKRDDYYEKLGAEAHHKLCRVTPRACPRCFMACGKRSIVKEGRHQGLELEGPEFETIYAFAGLCMIDDIPEVVYLNDLCDRYGIDTITAGNLVAFAMRASSTGRIGEKIDFGDVDATASLLHDMAYGRGLGEELAKGIVHCARVWDMEDEAVHVKGLEPAGYDPRGLKGMGLAYAVSDRGACHLRTTFYKPELAGHIAPDAIEGKARLFLDYEDRATLFDTLIMCRFFRDLNQWDELGAIIAGTTGMDPDRQWLSQIAANVTDAARVFNLREGLTREDDRLPPAMYKRPLEPFGQKITEEELDVLVQDYYRLRGWDEQGRPPSYNG